MTAPGRAAQIGKVKPAADSEKLSTAAQLLCAWPLILVVLGGAIGGGLGGLAWGINVKIYKSRLPRAAKIASNLGVGAAAICLWLFSGVLITSLR